MLLTDKVLIISGVGPGLGRELSEARRARAPRSCVWRGRPSSSRGVAADIRAGGGTATPVAGDVTSGADCERVAAIVAAEYGRLDGLVNSAFSVGALGVFPDVDLDDWRTALEVNLFGALRLVQAVLPLLEEGGGGTVINVNTTSSLRPMRGQGAYGTSKAALEFATRQLAVELGDRGIRANTVYCGPMAGPSLDDAMDSWARRQARPRAEIEADVASVMALGYIPEDAEAAQLILLLLADGARVVTGTSIHATGGAWVEQRF